MAYNKINFVNDETEASAENFDHMEDGILNSYNVSLLAVSDTAPSECSIGDKYYNTTTKKIYTATGTNTWGSTGEDPISDILYVVFSEKNTYSYDGTDLVSVGGGSGSEIVVEPDEPTEDTKLIFESIDLDAQYTEAEYYSTEEVKTNKVWIDGKPIYRKCFQTTSTANINTGIENDTIIKMDCLVKQTGSNNWRNIPWLFVMNNNIGDNAWAGGFYYTAGQIRFQAGSYLADVDKVVLIMEYTKTTDQATRNLLTRNIEPEEPIDEGDER